MPRIAVVFALSEPDIQTALLQEFALHEDVVASPHQVGDAPALRIECFDAVTTLWEVRATVAMFDGRAVEHGDDDHGGHEPGNQK